MYIYFRLSRAALFVVRQMLLVRCTSGSVSHVDVGYCYLVVIWMTFAVEEIFLNVFPVDNRLDFFFFPVFLAVARRICQLYDGCCSLYIGVCWLYVGYC